MHGVACHGPVNLSTVGVEFAERAEDVLQLEDLGPDAVQLGHHVLVLVSVRRRVDELQQHPSDLVFLLRLQRDLAVIDLDF